MNPGLAGVEVLKEQVIPQAIAGDSGKLCLLPLFSQILTTHADTLHITLFSSDFDVTIRVPRIMTQSIPHPTPHHIGYLTRR